MNLVLPVAPRDASLALELLAWVAELGGCLKHDLTVVLDRAVPLDTSAELSSVAASSFRSTTLHSIPTQEGWPAGPNDLFRFAASVAKTPWYFFEPDNTPLSPDWLDRIEAEYRAAGKPFMGCVLPRYFEHVTTKQRVQSGEHLVGTAIYPADLRAYTDAHLWCSEAFDLALHVAQYAHPTRSIQHNWNTCHYRREGEEIVCSPYPLRSNQTGDPRPNPVRPDAVVLHGCKDGSLIRLLRESIAAR